MITEIDKNTALVLIDLQKGILNAQRVHSLKEILEKIIILMESFRRESLPIVIVNVNPIGATWLSSRKQAIASNTSAPMPDFTEILEEIKTEPDDIFITKKTWNAFYNTQLHEELQKRNITNLVLGGVATSIGVEGTARAASELGYNISFAIDAMTDSNIQAHQNSIENIFPRIGELGTCVEIIEKLHIRVH